MRIHTPIIYTNTRLFRLFFAVFLLLIGVGFALYSSQQALKQSQDTRQQASESSEQLPKKIGVLEIAYFPPDPNNPQVLNSEVIDGPSMSITDAKTIITQRSQALKDQLGLSTKYHGYVTAEAQIFSDPDALEFLNYETIIQFDYENEIPAGDYNPPWNDSPAVRPDYRDMLNDISICSYVDNPNESQRVKEVWIWGYHTDKIEPVESNMSMGRNIQKFWNYTNYGDVSNSEQINDLPTCENTYVLFNYSGMPGDVGRIGYDMEDHTHQIEKVMKWLDEPNGSAIFWKKFVGNGSGGSLINNPGCGWTHYTPNSLIYADDYEWYLEQIRESDCMSWNPQGTGQKVDVSCHTWAGDYCTQDNGISFKTWWMQSLPGYNNDLQYLAPDGSNTTLTNWWDAIYNLDTYLQTWGRALYKSAITTPTPSPTPTPDYPSVKIMYENVPAEMYSGQTVTFTATLDNQSPITDDYVDLFFYDSLHKKKFTVISDQVNCEKLDGVTTVTHCAIGSINGYETKTISFSITPPLLSSPGSGKLAIYMQASSQDSYLEFDYIISPPPTPVEIKPDIGISFVDFPGQMISKQTYQFKVNIDNQDQPPRPGKDIQIYFYDAVNYLDFIVKSDDVECAKMQNAPKTTQCYVGNVEGASTKNINFSVIAPVVTNVENGSLGLFMMTMSDLNYDNNTVKADYNISPEALETSLSLSSDVPEKIEADSNKNLKFTIENTGSTDALNVIFDIYETTRSSIKISADESQDCLRVVKTNTQNYWQCSIPLLATNGSQSLNFGISENQQSIENGTIRLESMLSAENLTESSSHTVNYYRIHSFPNFADFNNDSALNRLDYRLIMNNIFKSPRNLETSIYDINKDGFIDITDVKLVTRQIQ